MRLRTIPLLLWLTLLIMSALEPASACSCVRQRAASPCRYFAEADAAFTGRVVQVADIDPQDRQRVIATFQEEGHGVEYLADIDWMVPRRVRFAVLQWWKGGSGPQAEIYAPIQPDTCGFSFAEGDIYLVYASRHQDRLESDPCSGTALLRDALDHPPLLENLRKGEPIREIYGTLPEGLPRPIQVTVRGSELELTDEDSEESFRFTGLPDGDYQVELRLPASFDPSPYRVHASIQGDSDCSPVRFEVRPSGSLEGILRDAAGKRIRTVVVSAQPEEDDSAPPLGFFGVTDKQGRFEISHLQPGPYRLEVYLGEPRLVAGGGYEPDWDSGLNAQIDAGAIRRVDDLHLPFRLTEVNLKGNVRWPDGEPAQGVIVFLVLSTGVEGIRDQVRTDSQGHFTLRGYRGLNYSVVAKTEGPNPMWARQEIQQLEEQSVTLHFVGERK